VLHFRGIVHNFTTTIVYSALKNGRVLADTNKQSYQEQFDHQAWNSIEDSLY
jgi:hypothetical protein